MQYIAMLTMLIDHVGYLFFPNDMVWPMIGRAAFPIYCYCIVAGYGRTRQLNKYFMRLFWIGAAAQIPYMLVFDTKEINVVGTLWLGLAAIYALDHYKGTAARLIIMLGIGAVLTLYSFDYGIYGLLLVIIYRYHRGHWMVINHLLLTLCFLALDSGWLLQLLSVLVTMMLAYAPSWAARLDRWRAPVWLWRSFYPGHLAGLYAAAAFAGHG